MYRGGWRAATHVPLPIPASEWCYALGLVGLLVALRMIWSVRTPYPDLKKKRPEAFG